MPKPRANLAITWINTQAWMIEPAALELMNKIASRQVSDFSAVLDKRAAYLDQNPDSKSQSRVQNGVAVIDINGPIFARAGYFQQISGATDVEALSAEFNLAMENPDIKGIVLHIDSPGGEVSGTSDLAHIIASARGKKKVYAFVQGMAASGAYWLASSAEKIFMADTASVGSIGVVMGYQDSRAADAANGIQHIEIVSSQSPDKRIDPATDDGRNKIQQTVDSIATVFVSTVAKNRGTTVKNVVENFGQGWVKVGAEAVSLGMADGINTLSDVLSLINNQTKGTFNMSMETENLDAQVKAAIAGERARISGIESLKTTAPGHDALIDRLKMEEDMTMEKVSMAILSAEKESREVVANAIAADARALAESTANAGASLPVEDKNAERNAISNRIAMAANKKNNHQNPKKES